MSNRKTPKKTLPPTAAAMLVCHESSALSAAAAAELLRSAAEGAAVGRGTFGQLTRFAITVGEILSDNGGSRRVDVWAANRWLTCDDDNVNVPFFAGCHQRAVRNLLSHPQNRRGRPYPELSVEDIYRRLRADGDLAVPAVRADGKIVQFQFGLRKIIESARPFSSKMHRRFHRRCTPIFMTVHTQGAVLLAHARVDSGV